MIVQKTKRARAQSAKQTNRGSSFQRDGFFVLKNFLNKDEVSAVREKVEEVMSDCHDLCCVRPNNTLLPLRWNSPVVGLFLKSKDRIGALKDAVDAADLKWISGYVSTKEPLSPPLWWHQDWWCWDHSISFKKATTQVALMCYLSSTNNRNGALRVLPGSHHHSVELHTVLPEAHADGASQIEREHIAMGDQQDQITLDLNAGDAVVIDYRLLHGTHGNLTTDRRDCVMLTFTPSWTHLPDDIKGHLVNHHALPGPGELRTDLVYDSKLLPNFDGELRDLQVNRIPPAKFVCS